MANNIPVFEFGKDSFILKHKINYNTSCENEWSAVTYGILFTDYDIARKTQSSNAENFDPIIISGSTTDLSAITLTYYDQEYILELSNHYKSTNLVNTTSFINNRSYQQYYIPSGDTSLFQIGDYFNIYFDIISGITGTIFWEHTGPSGETWVANGTTDNGIPYQVTGTTTSNGYSNGIATWNVVDYTPILKYKTKIISTGITLTDGWIRFERKIEDYYFNNLMKVAYNYNYTSLNYTLESLDFSDKSYYGIKYILEESNFSDYFSISATTNQIVIQPISNKKDLYFDYDNVEITTIGITDTTYKFNTSCLYTKYKLDIFLYQLGYNSGSTIYLNNNSYTTGTYNGETEFTIELTNSGDTEYFMPYTYIYASGDTNHICLITDVSGTTITLLSPRTGMTIGESITSINNMYTVYDISRMLYECYVNIENLYVPEYRVLGVQTKKNIYRAYAGIFENLIDLESMREKLTGILFENENSVFTFKIYNPANFRDNRLTYEPIEINRIGKNKKTSIPVRVFGRASGTNFNLIDSNIYDSDVYESDIYESTLVFDENV